MTLMTLSSQDPRVVMREVFSKVTCFSSESFKDIEPKRLSDLSGKTQFVREKEKSMVNPFIHKSPKTSYQKGLLKNTSQPKQTKLPVLKQPMSFSRLAVVYLYQAVNNITEKNNVNDAC